MSVLHLGADDTLNRTSVMSFRCSSERQGQGSTGWEIQWARHHEELQRSGLWSATLTLPSRMVPRPAASCPRACATRPALTWPSGARQLRSAVPPGDPSKEHAAAPASSKRSLGKPRTCDGTPRCASPCDDYLLVRPAHCADVTCLIQGICSHSSLSKVSCEDKGRAADCCLFSPYSCRACRALQLGVQCQ